MNLFLQVIAKDNGIPQRSSTASVIIEVIDYNDNPPQFASDNYHSSGTCLTIQCEVQREGLILTRESTVKRETVDDN